jgi:hypothetical protein
MNHELHLIADMLVFAIDHHSPATIILIAGDRDYACTMSALRLKQYNVILIAPPNIHSSLKSEASLVIDSDYVIRRKRLEADALLVWHWQPCRDIDEDTVQRLVHEIRDSYEDPSVALIPLSHSTSTIATIATHTQHVGAESSVPQRNTDSSDAAQPVPENAASIPPEMPGRSAIESAAPRAIYTTQSTQTVPDIVRDSVSLLTENNALSAHTYAMNAVEWRLNEGRAFFDDVVTPPTNNTFPPIAKTSGTLVSQEPSLAPSFPDFDLIMLNVESLQATSVNNFPEYHALPVESVEKIQRITAPQFLPLINQLLLARSKGNMRPRRSMIPVTLHEDDEDVYKLAGVNKFEDYALLAQEASLIELCGSGSEAWIALDPNLFEEETSVPESSTPLTVHSDNPSALHDDIRVSTSPTATIPPPNAASQSTIRVQIPNLYQLCLTSPSRDTCSC